MEATRSKRTTRMTAAPAASTSTCPKSIGPDIRADERATLVRRLHAPTRMRAGFFASRVHAKWISRHRPRRHAGALHQSGRTVLRRAHAGARSAAQALRARDAAGDWHEAADDRPYNALEYYEPAAEGVVSRFVGFIEDASMQPTLTRIAFRVPAPLDTAWWTSLLRRIGAVRIEPSASADYPAIFFEDPSGTKLEVCARKREVAEIG